MFDILTRVFCALFATVGLLGLIFRPNEQDAKWNVICIMLLALAALIGLMTGKIPATFLRNTFRKD